ncbi:MAG: cytochrome c oxidase assembly factor Coa1 family protein [Anaerolineae bacterium]
MTYPEPAATGKKRRNIILISCGVLTAVALCVLLIVGGVTGIVAVAFGSIKSSDVYQGALTEATTNSELINTLGEPIKAGLIPSGSISVENGTGEASLSIPISGPKGKGTLYVEATKSAGTWTYTVLEVAVDGRSDRIDLLAGAGR